MTTKSTAKPSHRDSSNRKPRRVFDVLIEGLRLTILTIVIITGIYGIYKNPADNNVKEITLLLLKKAPEVISSVKRLSR